MGKIIFWIAVFFVVLLALRLVNIANNAKRRDDAGDKPRDRRPELTAEPTVRCAECGTYLPKAEAQPFAGGWRCGDGTCARKR